MPQEIRAVSSDRLFEARRVCPEEFELRLTQIKLAGFKSFVDPTIIATPGQLVGIVGPNGCGKSNVIDAVRTRQPGRLMIDMRSVTSAAHVMTEVEAGIRERLAGQSLKDLIAAK